MRLPKNPQRRCRRDAIRDKTAGCRLQECIEAVRASHRIVVTSPGHGLDGKLRA
jgi:hypothetical protein